MKKTIWIIAALLSGLFVVEVEAAPAFQAAGTAVNGTASVSPAWPTHAINDVALLFVESAGGEAATLSTPAGFAAVTNSPQATGTTTNGTRITVFWARATSTAMTAPTVQDPGDHVYARILTYRGAITTGNPWDVTGGGVKAAASTSVTVTGVTTTVANTLIVQAVARDVTGTGGMFSAETNASLTGILERSDAGTTSGNGGGFAVWDGVKATAGPTGNTAATVTSSINAFLTIALIPPPGVATYYHDTTAGVNIGFDGTTNVTSGTNQTIPPIITASLITANTCTGNARSANHPTGLYTHSRWYLTTNYAVATNIAANPSGSARLRGGAATDTVIVRLYDYDPTPAASGGTGAKVLIGSSPVITLTGGTTTTNYPYTISSALYIVPAGHRLMLQYDFNQPTATYNARVYCSTTAPSYIAVTESTATVAPDHIEIDYPAPPFSTCAPTTVTVYACANAACSSYYTSSASVTLSPGGNVVSIPSGSGSASGTVFTTTAGAATLNAVSVPAGLTATTCKNTSTGTFSCSVNFAATSLAVTVPNLVSGNTVTGTVSGCTAQLPAGANTINFYTAYQNPASGTKQATINTTPVATSSPGTAISLTFDGASPSSSASFSLSYPDVGGVGLTAVKGAASGSASFIAVPHHFALSNIMCGNGTTYVGCIVASPYGIPFPVPTNASGAAFMKAGNPFSITVTAYNSASLATPNFGKETPAESVNLTPAANMPDLPGAVAGNLTGSFSAFSNGSATNAFAYSEAGIMTLTPSLNDPDAKGYLSIGNQTLNPVGAASGNIGRFIPDHFVVITHPASPVVTQADFLPQTATTVDAVGATAPTTVIPVAATAGFAVGGKVRIPGAGAGGNAFTASIAAINSAAIPPTLTLNTAISTSLAGGDDVVSEWGSYMGEQMNAQFTLNAKDLNGNTTQNYQGTYAKLNPAAAGNPLGLGAVDTAGPTYNLALDTATFGAATGSFSIVGSTGSATIIAPLAVTRGASAVGPYNLVKIGIAPTTAEADGVRMGAYNLGVTSATADHTSIMNPLVQDVTAVRYGRMKISNAYGSELLPLNMTATTQYWNGGDWTTNGDDSLTTIGLGAFTYVRKTGTSWTTNPTPTLMSGESSPATWTVRSGARNFSLSAPGTGNTGNVTVPTNAVGIYLPIASGQATFGVYKGSNNFIYMRENY